MTSSQSLAELRKELRQKANPAKAMLLQRFFKTGKGEYAEGDRFLGITVSVQRAFAKKYSAVSVSDSFRLLGSPYHEERLIALFLLVRHFEKGDEAMRRRIFESYLKATRFVNNWDLVDSSAYHIVGVYLVDRPRTLLTRLARSRLLWDRRVAIVATLAFIRRNDVVDTFRIASLLLKDKHDLMHKATGWMLREAGKKDPIALRVFLNRHATRMPRTMLRYAIERFSEPERLRYLKKVRTG